MLHHQFYKFPDDIVKKIPLHGQHFVGRHWKPTENKPRPEMENETFKPRVEKRFCKGFSNTSIHNKLNFFLSVGLDIPDYVTSNNEYPRTHFKDIIKRLVETNLKEIL